MPDRRAPVTMIGADFPPRFFIQAPHPMKIARARTKSEFFTSRLLQCFWEGAFPAMATSSKTERAQYRFTVKEYAAGTPWIMFELLRSPDLPVLGDGFLGMDLRPGTSYEE